MLACTIPTDAHESDGTLEWDATTIVITRVRAAGCRGVGDSYTDASAAALIYFGGREPRAPTEATRVEHRPS